MGENKWIQHSNGGGGIRFYTDNNNATNSQITISYASSFVLPEDTYSLDGKTYGIAYHNDSATAAALMAEEITDGNSQSSLSSLDMLMRRDVLDNDGILLVAENSNIQQWTFHSMQDENKYKLSTEIDGQTYYLLIDWQSVSLTPDEEEASTIEAIPGTGTNSGKWHFKVGGYFLNLSGTSYNALNKNDATTWLNLVEKSVLSDEDFSLYKAKKVSVSDEVNIHDGAQVIIYTRIWNNTTKKYEFYAVDHDGSLIRCYDTGDNIEWIGSRINTALWNFEEYVNPDGTASYYYELQNSQYDNYLTPNIAANQVLSEEALGINLNGRRYGESYTEVIAWDEANYAYSGLKTENGHVVACPLSEAEDFYFAVMNPVEEEDQLTTVKTIDNSQYGITMRMIDFNQNNPGVDREPVQHAFFGSHAYQAKNNDEGLLSTDLKENGYPDTTANAVGKDGTTQSLNVLFSEMMDVNHLFIQSIYNESGYFEFNSTQNYASLRKEDGTLGNTFTVYDELAAIGNQTTPTRTHGQFMPYNQIYPGQYAYDSKGNLITNLTSVNGSELNDLDPRKGEKLYVIPDNQADYFFGMEMEASFIQPADGVDAWNHDIIFEFSGDDDFWLYVDGELVLDIGGVHSALTGSVNFRTGEVYNEAKVKIYTSATDVTEKDRFTLRELLESNYWQRGMTQEQISAKLGEILEAKEVEEKTVYTFKDYSAHTMKMFYMERGAGASNLYMRFNLAAVKPGTIELSKKLSGTESESNSLIEFPYQIYYRTETEGAYERLTNMTGVSYNVTHKSDGTPVRNEDALTIDGVTYQDVFLLKPGEVAVIDLPDDTADYYIVECAVHDAVYTQVSANGVTLTGRGDINPPGAQSSAGDESVSSGRENYATSTASMEGRPRVVYENMVGEGAMRTLLIQKKLYDTDGNTILSYDATGDTHNETLFEFRLSLGNEFADPENLPLANLYSYYVKNAGNQYCRWENDLFQPIVYQGEYITEYEKLKKYLESLTSAERESVVFRTSTNGSIANIPAGYTVEVRDLIIGTQYKVEERDEQVPRGYTRRDEDGYARLDADHQMYQSMPYTGTMQAGENPKIEVRNQKGWGLTAEKVWTDADFMKSHDPIYFAVYVKDTGEEGAGGSVGQEGGSSEEGAGRAEGQEGGSSEEAGEGGSEAAGEGGGESEAAGEEQNTRYILYEGTVRQLLAPESEIYYFFHDLKYKIDEVEKTFRFSDFVIREVTISNASPTVVNGVVENPGTVTPIDGTEGSAILKVGGTNAQGEYKAEYEYSVSYEVGEPTGHNENIRTDTVTNSRPGIKILKTQWDGTTALGSAKFTLTNAESGQDVALPSYTSRDSDGLVTIAYLDEGGTYILSEVQTPQGYISLDEPMEIVVGNDGDITISGCDERFFIYAPATETSMACIRVKNRPVELRVEKVEYGTSLPLSGVHFALYRQVKDNSGNKVRDYLPMAGYEDLVTDETGLVPLVNLDTLRAGTYYLHETDTLDGYGIIEEDLCFAIGKDGRIKIESGGEEEWMSENEDEVTHKVTITIAVPNGQTKMVSIWKTDADHATIISGAKFNLYKKADYDDETQEPKSGADPLVLGMTGEDGILSLGSLNEGEYRLVEVAAPDGYVVCSSAIKITVLGESITAMQNTQPSEVVTKGSEYWVEGQDEETFQIRVWNNPGVELPQTGGAGTRVFFMVGLFLTTLAGVILGVRGQSCP